MVAAHNRRDVVAVGEVVRVRRDATRHIPDIHLLACQAVHCEIAHRAGRHLAIPGCTLQSRRMHGHDGGKGQQLTAMRRSCPAGSKPCAYWVPRSAWAPPQGMLCSGEGCARAWQPPSQPQSLPGSGTRTQDACGNFPGQHAARTGLPCLSARVCMAPGYMAHAGLIASTIRAMHITVVAGLAMFTALCRLLCEC